MGGKSKTPVPVGPPMTNAPCPKCLGMAIHGKIRAETVQRLPEGAFAPMDYERRKTCFDCQAASTVMKVMPNLDFLQARIAVGNDRQEQYRLPGVPMGLVKAGLMKPSADGDLDRQLEWLQQHVYPLIPEDFLPRD